CGSGRKYKKCCLASDQARPPAAASAPASENEGADGLESPAEAPPSTVEDDSLDSLWRDFLALKKPTESEMEEFLETLLVLSPEDTSWNEVFDLFADKGYADLPRLFRRIADTGPHTNCRSMAFFYWAAAETFERRGLRDMLPEVAAGSQKLDLASYDPDALTHIEDILLAAGFEVETLRLCEHFLPILRQDGGLMPYAVPESCGRIFELRIGEALRGGSATRLAPATLTEALRKGITKEIDTKNAAAAATAIGGETRSAWDRGDFDLVFGDITEDDDAWAGAMRLNAALVGVARDGWEVEQTLPGVAMVGLQMMLVGVYRSDAVSGRRRPGKNSGDNTLDNLIACLAPAGIEKRIVAESQDIIGVQVPRAHLLVDAHDLLRRFARRHSLMAEAESALTEKELNRLRAVLAR
ncbi:MAG: SEC-C domain-containing protein, partial [Chthoniobacteraceae bacterium]